MLKGFKLLEVQIASLILLFELIFATIIGAIFYHEIPGVLELFGGLLIISAMALPIVRENKTKNQISPEYRVQSSTKLETNSNDQIPNTKLETRNKASTFSNKAPN